MQIFVDADACPVVDIIEKIAEKYNIPLVITEHSSVERGPYVKKSYIPFICDSYKKAQKVITVGNGLKNEIESLSGRQDIEVIGNLVDLSKFTIKKRICNAVFAAIMRKRSGTNTQTIKIEDQCKN